MRLALNIYTELLLHQFAAACALDVAAVVGAATCAGGGGGDVWGLFIFEVATVDTDAILPFAIVNPLLGNMLALEDLVGIGSVTGFRCCLLSS